jgi:hypothetical protein
VAETASEVRHTCHVQDCGREVPRHLLMCAQHWRMVPRRLQLAVYRSYRPGQETGQVRLAADYPSAARAAINAVASLGARRGR